MSSKLNLPSLDELAHNYELDMSRGIMKADNQADHALMMQAIEIYRKTYGTNPPLSEAMAYGKTVQAFTPPRPIAKSMPFSEAITGYLAEKKLDNVAQTLTEKGRTYRFNLADLACEEALYDSTSLRRFVGIDLGREPVSDATTLLKFRKLLNDNQLGEALFAQVGQVLQGKGFKVNPGTIVDATIISAPSSTKNSGKARDPEMQQTRKGQQWYFGMKLHIGVDSQSGLAHSAVVTAANVHDKHPLPDLLHGNEKRVHGDSAYASQKNLIRSKAAKAKDFTNQRSRRNGVINEETRSKVGRKAVKMAPRAPKWGD